MIEHFPDGHDSKEQGELGEKSEKSELEPSASAPSELEKIEAKVEAEIGVVVGKIDKAVRKRFLTWRRFRLYSWALLLSAGILVLGLSIFIARLRDEPIVIIRQVLDSMPFPYHVASVRWLDDRTIVIQDLAMGTKYPDQPGESNKTFFRTSRVLISFSGTGLLNRRLENLELHHTQLFLERFDAAIQANPWQGSAAEDYVMRQMDWIFKTAKIYDGTVVIENVGPNKNLNIPIRLGTQDSPVLLRDLHLNDLDAGESGQVEQTVKIPNVTLVSPFDPLAPVVALPLTVVKFTYGGLWHRHLREVNFIRPTIFLGPDLFWFADGFNGKPVKGEKPMLPWRADKVVASYGVLGISAFGQKPVSFPFEFGAEADNLRTDQLDKLSLKTAIPIKRFDHDYTSYKIKIVDLHGNLAFNLPPSQDFIENAVQTIQIDEVSWNGLAVDKAESTLIFNPYGVFGHLRGTCYGGNVRGDFGITYSDGFPWVLAMTANNVNVEPITQRLTPQYFVITGKASGSLRISGETITILDSQGSLKMAEPGGEMRINSVDKILKQYPLVGNQIRQAAVQVLANSLKLYPYTAGEITLNYTPTLGEGHLRLSGPRGKRDFDVFYHPAPHKDDKVAGATKVTSAK